MTTCDMCGKDTKLFLTEIEGTRLNVCIDCAKYGTKVRLPKPKRSQFKREKKPDRRRLKNDFYILIRKKREELGLKQEEFAKMLSEKESIIHKIESGSYKPSLDTAGKIERKLGLSLIEEVKVEEIEIKQTKQTLTIGDMIKIK